MNRKTLAVALASLLLAVGCTKAMEGNMALRNENYAEAISLYSQHLAEDPDDWKVREKLGYAYLKADQPEKAIDQLRPAAANSEDNSLARLYLGLAYLKQGDLAATLDTWKGFEDKKRPKVEEEVKRLTTLLEIAQAKKMAKQAMAQEKNLEAVAIKPDSYAVLYFANLSNDASMTPVQKAIASMVITDLSQIESINVVERVRLQALLEEMRLGQSGVVDEGTAPKVGRLLGAERIVVGNLSNPMAQLRVSAGTASTRQNKMVNSFSVSAPDEEFFQLQKEIVYNIVSANDIALTQAEQERIKGFHTKDYQAMVYYGQALDALDQGDWQSARDYFELALKQDPWFLLARGGRDSAPSGVGVSAKQLDQMAAEQLSASVEASVTTSVEAAVESAVDEAEAAQRASDAQSTDTGVGGEGEGGSSH